MDFYITIFLGLIFSLVSLTLSSLVRHLKISAKKAALATTITLILLNTIFLYTQNIDDLLIGWLCTSALFVIIGVMSYFVYKMLEVKFSRDPEK